MRNEIKQKSELCDMLLRSAIYFVRYIASQCDMIWIL